MAKKTAFPIDAILKIYKMAQKVTPDVTSRTITGPCTFHRVMWTGLLCVIDLIVLCPPTMWCHLHCRERELSWCQQVTSLKKVVVFWLDEELRQRGDSMEVWWGDECRMTVLHFLDVLPHVQSLIDRKKDWEKKTTRPFQLEALLHGINVWGPGFVLNYLDLIASSMIQLLNR